MTLVGHQYYEIAKGVRNLALPTTSAEEARAVVRWLQLKDMACLVQRFGADRANVFFGQRDCVEVVRRLLRCKLNQLSDEEDFMLGVLLGYDCLQPCKRYLDRDRTAACGRFAGRGGNSRAAPPGQGSGRPGGTSSFPRLPRSRSRRRRPQMTTFRERKAFTLIELLIVIGLLGSLAAIILPSFHVRRVDSLEQIVAHDMAEIRKAFQRLHADAMLMESDLDQVRRYGLACLMERPDGSHDGWTLPAFDPQKQRGWRGPYLEQEGHRRMRADGTRHILSIENPVEVRLDGINQVEVDARGQRVSFTRALRSALRHDPDVLMIGEIRDAESCDIAIKSALTGHLVFSTVHANSAANVTTRLLDMGVSPFLLASAVLLVVAQRLVRRPCPQCMRLEPCKQADCRRFGIEPRPDARVPVTSGCTYCGHTGYAGRLGLYEMIPINDSVRALLVGGAGEDEIAEEVFGRLHLPRLRQNGALKVLEGKTTWEEVDRVTIGEVNR